MGGNDSLNGAAGDDTLAGGEGADSLNGGIGADTLYGDDGADTVLGAIGDDLLVGGGGADRLMGGGGNDRYVVDGRTDTILELRDAGSDVVIVLSSFVLPPNVETLVIAGEAPERSSGTGNAQANTLLGNAVRNVLAGQGGDDTIFGGDGWDGLLGGDGDDRLAGEGATDGLFGGKGRDLLDGGAARDRLFGEEGDDILLGGAEDLAGDILSGDDGADWLDGGPGVDSMSGSLGNDTFVAGTWADVVLERPGEGIDTVIARAPKGYALPAEVEILILEDAARDGVGNALGNHIQGNALWNRLYGNGGATRWKAAAAGIRSTAAAGGTSSCWAGPGAERTCCATSRRASTGWTCAAPASGASTRRWRGSTSPGRTWSSTSAREAGRSCPPFRAAPWAPRTSCSMPDPAPEPDRIIPMPLRCPRAAPSFPTKRRRGRRAWRRKSIWLEPKPRPWAAGASGAWTRSIATSEA